MTEEQLIKILKKSNKALSTGAFLDRCDSSFAKFGKLTQNMRTALFKIADERGIKMTEGKPGLTVVRESAPAVIEEIKGSCGDCHDGLVLALQNISKNLYSFRCECSVGEKRQEKYPIWRHYHAKEYSIDRPSL